MAQMSEKTAKHWWIEVAGNCKRRTRGERTCTNLISFLRRTVSVVLQGSCCTVALEPWSVIDSSLFLNSKILALRNEGLIKKMLADVERKHLEDHRVFANG